MPRIRQSPAPKPLPPVKFTGRGMKRLREWKEKRDSLLASEEATLAEFQDLKKQVEKKKTVRKLFVLGNSIDPTIPERRLAKVRWVKDIGVTARGQGNDRRLVAFVVLLEGKQLADVELDLKIEAGKLPAYLRPLAFAQVPHLPRDPVLGHLLRNNLRVGGFDGRTFRLQTGEKKKSVQRVTATIRNPINKVTFEGVVACAVDNRRDGDPPGKHRHDEARLVLSHRLPGSKSKLGMSVSFVFKGALAKKVAALDVGQRVCVTGKIVTALGGRRFLGVSFQKVNARVERVDSRNSDSVIQALL